MNSVYIHRKPPHRAWGEFDIYDESKVLARVQAFLPELLTANRALDQRVARENQSSVDIESFDGTESSYIEMVCLSSTLFFFRP